MCAGLALALQELGYLLCRTEYKQFADTHYGGVAKTKAYFCYPAAFRDLARSRYGVQKLVSEDSTAVLMMRKPHHGYMCNGFKNLD